MEVQNYMTNNHKRLTRRQLEYVKLKYDPIGYSKKEIAAKLGVSLRTVYNWDQLELVQAELQKIFDDKEKQIRRLAQNHTIKILKEIDKADPNGSIIYQGTMLTQQLMTLEDKQKDRDAKANGGDNIGAQIIFTDSISNSSPPAGEDNE